MKKKPVIDDETFENLLYLSRLSPESTNKETLTAQVRQIVEYFEVLSKYAGDENPYDAYPAIPAEVLRGNDVGPAFDTADLKQMTPEFKDGYFRVPGMLGNDDHR
ncbi:MAG TPA: aspartyl/glutamyl-tRNA amidotransferase subunit C [Treponemataceae bacterium]|nr:aspartyl/glutamyl-tRNA amidotransferase subunit C [Treponemataceae bacterium]HOS35790.1 aspartyl/glutamyl-tRNA amidotransferase subunit C [Treponemataceae bacterium]HPL91857.1 aspartyl/glutamyl-tRNA amidotransferase subunit C [Treponemataceae bacterium]